MNTLFGLLFGLNTNIIFCTALTFTTTFLQQSEPISNNFCTVLTRMKFSVSQHNSKTNDPKVLKLGAGNILGIYSKWYAFGLKRSKVKVTASMSILHTRTAIHRHSLGGIISRLRLRGCIVRASLTFARWRNQSSAWNRTLWVPSSWQC